MPTYADFTRLDLRIGTVLTAAPFPEARNPSYRLTIDFGALGVKKSSAQLTALYRPEDLVGRQVVAVVNFPVRQIATMMSECLVLGGLDGRRCRHATTARAAGGQRAAGGVIHPKHRSKRSSVVRTHKPPGMIRILLLFGVFYCTCVPAQERLSLSDAIQEGLENNFQIRIAANQLAVARNDDDYALTQKYPTVTLGLSPGVSYRNQSNPASIVAQSTTTSYTVAPIGQFNWVLFNGGRIELNKERLATLAELSSGQLQLQVENTVQDIINAYYNAVVQLEQIGVRERVLKLSRDRIEYQEVRSEFGQGGTFDELQARDAFLNDSSSLVQQRVGYRNAVRNLLQLMGTTQLDRDVALTDELTYEPAVYDTNELEARLLARNQQLQNLLVNRDLAALQTQLIEAERAPVIGIGAGASYDISVQTGTQTFDFGGDQPSREQELPGVAARTLAGNVGFTASYLLFDGGNRRVRAQSSRLQEITVQLDYQAAQQQLRTALLNTLALYDNQLAIIGITQGLIDNAERNIEIAEERYRGGTINSFDYRQIQLNYANAEFQLLNALLNLKSTETELLRVTGGIVR